jgi:hypothetical protein
MAYTFKEKDVESILSILSVRSTTKDKVDKIYKMNIKNRELLVFHIALGLVDVSTNAAIYAYDFANEFKIEDSDFKAEFLPNFKDIFLPTLKLIRLLKTDKYKISPGVIISLSILRSEDFIDDESFYKLIEKYLKGNKHAIYEILECLNTIMNLLLSPKSMPENVEENLRIH